MAKNKAKSNPAVDRIIQSIDELFSDISVDQATTRSRLEDIRDHLNVTIEALPECGDE